MLVSDVDPNGNCSQIEMQFVMTKGEQEYPRFSPLISVNSFGTWSKIPIRNTPIRIMREELEGSVRTGL